jgi:hypothetical protein
MQSINDESQAPRGFTAKVAVEVKKFLAIFLYLFVLLGFYVICEDVILRRSGIDFAANGFAAINAAVFGKVILIGEDMKFGQWPRNAPLAYAIAFQSLLFTALLIVFHFLEHAIINTWRDGTALLKLDVGGGGWLGLACVAILMFVGLVPFFAYRNLARVIGADRLRAILFGKPDRRQGDS